MLIILAAICVVNGELKKVDVVQTEGVKFLEAQTGVQDAWLVKDKSGETHRVRADNCEITKARIQ